MAPCFPLREIWPFTVRFFYRAESVNVRSILFSEVKGLPLDHIVVF